jgi:hypothetical protein
MAKTSEQDNSLRIPPTTALFASTAYYAMNVIVVQAEDRSKLWGVIKLFGGVDTKATSGLNLLRDNKIIQ